MRVNRNNSFYSSLLPPTRSIIEADPQCRCYYLKNLIITCYLFQRPKSNTDKHHTYSPHFSSQSCLKTRSREFLSPLQQVLRYTVRGSCTQKGRLTPWLQINSAVPPDEVQYLFIPPAYTVCQYFLTFLLHHF